MKTSGKVLKLAVAFQVIICGTLIGNTDNALANSGLILGEVSESVSQQHHEHNQMHSGVELALAAANQAHVDNAPVEVEHQTVSPLANNAHLTTRYLSPRNVNNTIADYETETVSSVPNNAVITTHDEPSRSVDNTPADHETETVSPLANNARTATRYESQQNANNTTINNETDTVSPVPSAARISSWFGYRRGRTSRRRTFHAGLDYYAPRGTPVFAARDGNVEIIARDSECGRSFSGYGNAVVIFHADENRWSLYAHLDEINVELGAEVSAGDVIGRIGNTSNRRFRGMAHHLHFEIRGRTKDGDTPFPGPYRVNNINPLRWLANHSVRYDRDGYEMCGNVQCYVENEIQRTQPQTAALLDGMSTSLQSAHSPDGP